MNTNTFCTVHTVLVQVAVFSYKLLYFQLLPHALNVLHLVENNAGADGHVFSYKRRQVLNLFQLSVIA
jgi:hypothetical protein